MTKIYHNPRCGKSRNTLSLLQEHNEDIEIIEYLKTVPSKEELSEVLSLLGLTPLELIRKGEKIFKEQYKNQKHNDEEWINIMVQNPILIERPIVIKNGKAIIGRPPENVLEIL
ncbi:arsenate reductase (glutaredoxin) [Reichenbachiella sp. 5M10]|uniref:arsenate reductase (glutaredoxin) n=1 Tax=Reichenbachiella sp. 5M10 TaxID=1889772 RepID=UPI000C15C9E7|nr:arsenate reductase (glutaredoxin) [Reichenbachiella sp. 5M10]PIB34402.1 arsenate reductase (glutaredoxin) [Reichenbachiella sp. 5M10]